MHGRRKAVLIAICIVAAFIVACMVIAPRFFRVDRYRPYVITLIEQKTGRRVSIGRLGLTVFPFVSIRVDQVAISNPPNFPTGNWLTVKRIDARLDLRALWHHQIVVRSLQLNQPSLDLISNAHGRWNYQLPRSRALAANSPPPRHGSARPAGYANPASSAQDPPLFTLREISELTLKDGNLVMANLAPDGKPGPPAIVSEGVTTNLKNIDLEAFANPRSPSAALANATGTLSLKALEVSNLRLTHIKSSVEASPAQIALNDLKFDFYGGHGRASVLLHLLTPVLEYTAQGDLSGVNAEQMASGFPQAQGQLTGTLRTHFTFSGDSSSSPDPWAGKQGQGTLTVVKGRLPKLRLGQSLLSLAKVAQMGPASGDPAAFSVISLDWQLAQDVMTTRNVHLEGNGIAVNGAGRIDFAGPGGLNYQGVAEITAQQNPLTNILANLSGANFSNGKLRLPFTLEGTLAKPQFRIKTARTLGGAFAAPARKATPAQQNLQNLFNLFKRKK